MERTVVDMDKLMAHEKPPWLTITAWQTTACVCS
jgi:hypothetical protein